MPDVHLFGIMLPLLNSSLLACFSMGVLGLIALARDEIEVLGLKLGALFVLTLA